MSFSQEPSYTIHRIWQPPAEFFRVLKPGGRLIAIENVISSKNDLPVFLDQHPLHKLYGGECFPS